LSRLVSVAVPVPFLDLLTYRVPDDLVTPARGARVIVPLGKRRVTGVAVGETEEPGLPSSADSIKDIHDIVDDDAFLPDHIVGLALWVAEYYACGAGDAIAAAMPPPRHEKTVRAVSLTAQGRDPELKLTARQREVVDALLGSPAGLSTTALKGRGISADILRRMALRGLVTFNRERVDRDPFSAGMVTTPAEVSERSLTDEQTRVMSTLRAMAEERRFAVALLQGVTGSGKTEVYLRLAQAVRLLGRTVLILVPEIALTPAIASIFRQSFGEQVAVQHSGLSTGERYDQWCRIRSGVVSVVIGTRSAVFAPIGNLGLIVVDEEHDSSFKQEEMPRYNGRDVAVMRGQRDGALVVLGSATPSLESAQNAERGRYSRLTMTRRVEDRPLAAVTLVDMRQEYAARGPDVILSERLTAAIDQRLRNGQQSLVLLNRRGLATAVFCRQCGSTLDCPNCSVSLIVHGGGGRHRARCHYCNYAVDVPKACLACAGPYLERRGFGTEKVAADIAALWPAARVRRLDRDAARRRGAAAEILRAMAAGSVDVLVGTQMIAKGHDFPRVTLVGVISADVGLGVADFRAAERTFQLLTQVAGRAGRGADAGEAIVQTLYPNHYSIRHACRQDYAAFFEEELRYRKAMRYPPLTALVNVIVRAPAAGSAMHDATMLAEGLRSKADGGHFIVLGPASAAVAKIRGEHRAQLLLKGRQRSAMRDALMAILAEQPAIRRRVSVDVDPVSVL
jgi:primosomal protein N' (replication factor Y) (superfamily II helicase)